MALVMTPSAAAAMSGVPVDKAGVGSAVLNSARQVGGSIGIALIGAIVAHEAGGRRTPEAFVDGFSTALRGGGADRARRRGSGDPGAFARPGTRSPRRPLPSSQRERAADPASRGGAPRGRVGGRVHDLLPGHLPEHDDGRDRASTPASPSRSFTATSARSATSTSRVSRRPGATRASCGSNAVARGARSDAGG